MTISESILVALFCILMVFFVLFCLWILIKLFSRLLGAVSGKKKHEPIQPLSSPATEE